MFEFPSKYQKKGNMSREMKEKGKAAKWTAGVSLSTMLSRALGYIRDMLIANMLGAGMAADALFVAYRIPNLFRRLLGEGALSSSFIPVFVEYLKTKGDGESKKFVKSIFTVLVVILIMLAVAGWILTPQIVRLIAPGFTGNPEKLALTITITRIIFPFMIAIGLGALTLGILNSLGKFIIPALAPCMLSISEIVFILVVCPFMESPVYGLAAGILLGGFAQFAFQVPALAKRGYFSFSFIKELINIRSLISHPGVKKVGLLILPAAVGLSISQINVFVDTICASVLEEGSVTALYYANRVMQLPLALFGTAIATVSLPLMSESSVRKDFDGLKGTLASGLKMIIFTILPATMGLIFLGVPIIRVLFERGAFSSHASEVTGFALAYYAAGLVGYAGVKLVVSAFYSFKDTKTPVRIAACSMALNIILNLILMRILGVGGLALATALAAMVNLILLLIYLRKRIGSLGLGKMILSSIKIFIASLSVMLVCMLCLKFLGGTSKYLFVGITIPFAVGVYFLSAYLLGCDELKYIRKMMVRG